MPQVQTEQTEGVKKTDKSALPPTLLPDDDFRDTEIKPSQIQVFINSDKKSKNDLLSWQVLEELGLTQDFK